MTETLLTAAEAARAAGVSRARVYAAITSGALPTAPGVVGNAILVRAADVDAWRAAPRSKGGRPRRADRHRPQDTTRRGQD